MTDLTTAETISKALWDLALDSYLCADDERAAKPVLTGLVHQAENEIIAAIDRLFDMLDPETK